MEKICPILLQAVTPKQIERASHDPYNLYGRPNEARCIRHECVAYDSTTQICKHYNNKIFG